ncbi:MAG: GldG family protein [Bdellovibrionia bacterium]
MNTNLNNKNASFWEKNASLVLGLGAAVLVIALILARLAFSEMIWLTAVLVVLLAADLALWIRQNQQALRSRTTAYGINSAVSALLVLGLLCVVNFMASRYPHNFDLTRNKVNSLSDQTVKLVKGLKSPVKVTMFAKAAEKERFRPILDNYKNLNATKFEVEYVDPDREPTRTKTAGIKKYGTALLSFNGRDSKVEDVNEEKLTNALIKLTKDKTPTLCAVAGHGEKVFTATDAEGYDAVRKALVDQSYEVKEINIVQEQGKIPAVCDAIAIVGPTKAFFDPEIKAIREYLNNGGRAVIAVDVALKGAPYAPELMAVLADWNVKATNALIVDPVSRMFNVDASMPIVANFSRNNPITRDFGANTPSAFPMARPLEVATTAQGITPDAIGKTTAQSFAVTDFKGITGGELKVNPTSAPKGPFNVALAIDGKQKDSKATRNTRLVVFGSSLFAANQFSRFGVNLDFFVNSVSWVLEDESMISIRAKEEGPGKIEMTARTGSIIFWFAVILIPAAIAVSGVVIWAIRRRW